MTIMLPPARPGPRGWTAKSPPPGWVEGFSWCGSGDLAATGPDLLEALLEDVLQLRDGAALQQHVPVGARGLDLLLLRLRAVDQPGDAAVELALPGDRDLGVDRERNLEAV